MWQNRNLQRWTCLLMFRQFPHPRKVRLHPRSPGILKAMGKPESRMRRNSKSDAASSSQVRLQDAYLGRLMDTATGKAVATKRESGDVDLSESETGSEEFVTGKPIAYKTVAVNPMHPVNQTTREVQKLKGQSGHSIYTCLQSQSTMRKQSSRSSRESTDENMTRGIFLNATLRAAVHLGQDDEANLRYVKNSVGLFFHETGKLISEQKEITVVSTKGFKDATLMSTSLLCEKAYQIINAKAYVFSDSVRCVGKMGDDPVATWKNKITWVFGE